MTRSMFHPTFHRSRNDNREIVRGEQVWRGTGSFWLLKGLRYCNW